MKNNIRRTLLCTLFPKTHNKNSWEIPSFSTHKTKSNKNERNPYIHILKEERRTTKTIHAYTQTANVKHKKANICSFNYFLLAPTPDSVEQKKHVFVHPLMNNSWYQSLPKMVPTASKQQAV
mmetsp:Transcript_72583/g.115837  ORF Transcript_72583/g.115837 Transcript_72583/m.115837 type:complete len:122 (-) Transcript_72583:603-968(-)